VKSTEEVLSFVERLDPSGIEMAHGLISESLLYKENTVNHLLNGMISSKEVNREVDQDCQG
jgi:hypothetical protein